MALGSVDGRIRTGKHALEHEAFALPGPPPQSEAWTLAFTPDGQTLIAGYDHEDGTKHRTLGVWDWATRKVTYFDGHDAIAMSLGVTSDSQTLASASYDGTVRLWDLPSRKPRLVCKGHTDAVRALALSPDGRRVASGGSDLTIKIWNVADGKLQASWQGHSDCINALTFSRDGRWLLSGSNDHTIKIWNPDDGRLLQTLQDEGQVHCLACSPDGTWLASGNDRHQVKWWHLPTGDQAKVLRGHTGTIRTIAFSPDGMRLATGGEDKSVRVWNTITSDLLLLLPTEHVVNAVAFPPKNQFSPPPCTTAPSRSGPASKRDTLNPQRSRIRSR